MKQKITSFYRGPNTILEVINDLNFRVQHAEKKNELKVHNDRMKKYPKFCKTQPTEKRAVFEQIGTSDEKDNDFVEIEIQNLAEPVNTQQVQPGTSDGEKPLT